MVPIAFVLLFPFVYLMCVTFVYLTPVFIAFTIAFVVIRGVSELAGNQIKRSHTYAKLEPIVRQALPPSKEEAQALVLHAQARAEIEAEIADALLIAQNMPKTLAEAQRRLTEAQEKVIALEARVAVLEARAKAQSGGWAVVCEARGHLDQAERDLTEALQDCERFPKQITADRSSGCEHWRLLHSRTSSDHAAAAVSGARSMSSGSIINQMRHWPATGMKPTFTPLQKPLPSSVLRSLRSPPVRQHCLGLLGRPLLTALRRL